MTENILQRDLDHILDQTRNLWEELRGRRIFISGGTGFFGCWLLESFVWATERLKLNASAIVLTRDPARFERKAPHLAAHSAVRLCRGDIRSFAFPDGQFEFVIHAATDTNNQATPLDTLDSAIAGTRHVLEFAQQCGTSKVLFTSSGAVYGKQPGEMTHVPEDFLGGPDPADPCSVYAEGKRVAELLCGLYAAQLGMECKIARCFAFAGPYLAIDSHFAFANFVRDAMQGRAIRVTGDGTPYRSYLYAADLALWLWTILFRGRTGRPYNVGSERAISIAELAREVVQTLNPELNIEVEREPVLGRAAERYIPSTKSARDELGLQEFVDLREAIVRTSRWHLNRAISG